jgi:hypothetical protein
MVGRALDDKLSDTLVVVSGEGSWTGSSTLPHLHHFFVLCLVPCALDMGGGARMHRYRLTRLLLAQVATDTLANESGISVPAVSSRRREPEVPPGPFEHHLVAQDRRRPMVRRRLLLPP